MTQLIVNLDRNYQILTEITNSLTRLAEISTQLTEFCYISSYWLDSVPGKNDPIKRLTRLTGGSIKRSILYTNSDFTFEIHVVELL